MDVLPRRPDVILLAETHEGDQKVVPSVEGYRLFSAPGPRGRGGVAALVSERCPASRVSLWRSRPEQGVLWVRLDGAGPGGATLLVVVAYLPPSNNTPEDWFAELAVDWAAALGVGVPFLLGDLNAHTGTAEDWPPDQPDLPPRHSADRARVDARGKALLEFCQAHGVRILNGRAPGDEQGAGTSRGIRVRGGRGGPPTSVVDYGLVGLDLWAAVHSFVVVDSLASDHQLVLSHLAAGAQRPRAQRPGGGPAQRRFRFQPELRDGVQQALEEEAPQLAALADAAEAATTLADVEQVAAWRDEAVAAAAEAAGARPVGPDPRQPGQQHVMPRERRQHYGVTGLAQQLRQARKPPHGPGSVTHHSAQVALKKAKRQMHAEAKAERGEALERLVKEDSSGFWKAFRQKKSALASALQPKQIVLHFQRLLGMGPAPPSSLPLPERPPPEPPPAAAPTLRSCRSAAVHDRPALGETDPGMEQGTGSIAPSLAPPPPADSPTRRRVATLATLRAGMHAPFAIKEVSAAIKRTPLRKAVVGMLTPWLAKAAEPRLAVVLAAEFQAWRRVGRLPACAAVSSITPIPKPGGDPSSCDSLRGIAVGTLPAKAYASILERRVSDYTEAAGARAQGQFGFRRGRGPEQAALVLRTAQEVHRESGQQLWVCYVDFKQAYDRVPREQLWERLEEVGLGGEWLEAVRALYADVPMTVGVPGGAECPFQAHQGVKQGCPLSPTLFGLYIDDLEEEIMAAAERGEALDLPVVGGQRLPPILFADDTALLATSAAGLQRQLDLLERYCVRKRLTVNSAKTKVMLLAGARTEALAMETALGGRVRYAGSILDCVTSFAYLGIVFHSTHSLGLTAVAARVRTAQHAMRDCRARCAELGLERAPVLMQLYDSLVESKLSYGAAVWAPHLAAMTAGRQLGRGQPSAAERLQATWIRLLLGVRRSTPSATVLAEAGAVPLYVRWLLRAARLWNCCLAESEGSVLRLAFTAGTRLAAGQAAGTQLFRRPWAGQLQQALAAVGVEVSLEAPTPIHIRGLRQAGLEHFMGQIQAAAEQRQGGGRFGHYVTHVWGGERPEVYSRAAYLDEVRRLPQRQALAQLRLRAHWGAEETMLLEGVRERHRRVCPHCVGAVETADHMALRCPRYDALRAQWADLFGEPHTLHSFLQQPAERLAAFVAAIRRVRLGPAEVP